MASNDDKNINGGGKAPLPSQQRPLPSPQPQAAPKPPGLTPSPPKLTQPSPSPRNTQGVQRPVPQAVIEARERLKSESQRMQNPLQIPKLPQSQEPQKTTGSQKSIAVPQAVIDARERLKSESQRLRISNLGSSGVVKPYQKPTSGPQAKKYQCSQCQAELGWDCLQQNAARIQDGNFICVLCDLKALAINLKKKRFRLIGLLASLAALIGIALRPADFVFILMGLTGLAVPFVYFFSHFRFLTRTGLAMLCMVLFFSEVRLLVYMRERASILKKPMDPAIEEGIDIREYLKLNDYVAAFHRFRRLLSLAGQDSDSFVRKRRTELVLELDKSFSTWRTVKYGASTLSEHKLVHAILEQFQDCQFKVITLSSNAKTLTLEYSKGASPEGIAQVLLGSSGVPEIVLKEVRIKCLDNTPCVFQTITSDMLPAMSPSEMMPPNPVGPGAPQGAPVVPTTKAQ